jgi:hypothetical protein
MQRVVVSVLVIGAVVGAVLVAQATRSAESTPEPTKIVQTVPLGAAGSAQIDGRLGAGSVRLAGGTVAGAGRPLLRGELLRAEFTTADDTVPPAISAEVVGDSRRVRLVQEHGASLTWPWESTITDWTLYLNPTVPTALSLELGAGDANLALGGLSLTDLTLANGAGDTTLDLTGDWQTNLDASVRIGAGDLTLRLPRHVGVRVEVDQVTGHVEADGFTEADGFYTNDAYGEAPVNLSIEVDQGVGNVELELVG